MRLLRRNARAGLPGIAAQDAANPLGFAAGDGDGSGLRSGDAGLAGIAAQDAANPLEFAAGDGDGSGLRFGVAGLAGRTGRPSVVSMEAHVKLGCGTTGRGYIGAALSSKSAGTSGEPDPAGAVLHGNPPEMAKKSRFLGLSRPRRHRCRSPRDKSPDQQTAAKPAARILPRENRESGTFWPFPADFCARAVRAGHPARIRATPNLRKSQLGRHGADRRSGR